MNLILPDSYDDLESLLGDPAQAVDEIDRIECEESLLAYMKRMWHVLEPSRPLSVKWPLEAVCEHLEAITNNHIKRLLITVPPGWAKSITTDAFWPSWEWGPRNLSALRYLAFSYSSLLTLRDNGRFRDLITHPDYARLFGNKFNLIKTGEELISNDKTGWKLASSVGGVSTGARGDRVVVDDPHNIKEGESEAVRGATTTWFREALQNRLNDRDSSIVVIMQRVHQADVAGVILSEMNNDYEHLSIPYEWEGNKTISTVPEMKWSTDPRTELGEEAWPERLPMPWKSFKVQLGPYAKESQYQQRPSPRGGSIIRDEYWRVWDPPVGSDGLTRFPQCEFVVASLDGAFGQDQTNDWTALTVWGVFSQAMDEFGGAHSRMNRPYLDQVMATGPSGEAINPSKFVHAPNMILMHAWRKRLPLNGVTLTPRENEQDGDFRRRQMAEWGIVQWVLETCRRFRVSTLLVEAKANGIDVSNEVKRQMSGQRFDVQLINPGRLDKTARAHAVQNIWSGGLVWAPVDEPGGYGFKDWAQEVIDEMAAFPRAAHDDYTDTATQVAKWLRDRGFLLHAHEVERQVIEDIRQASKGQSGPLYPA